MFWLLVFRHWIFFSRRFFRFDNGRKIKFYSYYWHLLNVFLVKSFFWRGRLVELSFEIYDWMGQSLDLDSSIRSFVTLKFSFSANYFHTFWLKKFFCRSATLQNPSKKFINLSHLNLLHFPQKHKKLFSSLSQINLRKTFNENHTNRRKTFPIFSISFKLKSSFIFLFLY